MNNLTRQKRKMEKQRRKEKWLHRHNRQTTLPVPGQVGSRTAALSRYGQDEMDHWLVAVCEGSNPISYRGRPTANAGPEHEHAHEWVVFSTALGEGWLMLQCVECALHATVEDPSRGEWSQASRAPSKPYRWHDETRVVVQGHRSGNQLYVVRSAEGPRCECYDRRNVLEPGEYERVPIEATRPPIPLSDEDRKELECMAEVVCAGTLCSFLFSFYLQCFERDTGHQPGQAVREVARRIEVADRKGLHCSPSVVGIVLQEVAAGGQPPEATRTDATKQQ